MTFRQAFVSGFKDAIRLGLFIAVAPFAQMRAFVRHDLPSHH